MSARSRAAVHAALSRIHSGRIELSESWSGETRSFGRSGAELSATLEIHDPRVYTMLVRRRSVGLGEAYAAGLWDTDALVPLMRIGGREVGRFDRIRRRLAPLSRPLHRLSTLPLLNTRRGARRNIAAHYDLGNELFETFLDRESMMYSSAYFEHEGQSLEEAQRTRSNASVEPSSSAPPTICSRSGPDGAGSRCTLRARYGCRVTTTTISREQRAMPPSGCGRAGLEDRVTVLGSGLPRPRAAATTSWSRSR